MLFPYDGTVLNESAPVDSLIEKSDLSEPPDSDQKIDFEPLKLPVLENVWTAEVFSAKEKEALPSPAFPLGPLISIFCPRSGFRSVAFPVPLMPATMSAGCLLGRVFDAL